MAAIPVTISGVLYDKVNRTTQNVTLIGLQSKSGLTVGGGPIIPETPPEIPPPDLIIWQDPGGYNPNDPNNPWPPETPPPDEKPPFEVKVVWTEENGWAVVIIPTGEHPTPSRRK